MSNFKWVGFSAVISNGFSLPLYFKCLTFNVVHANYCQFVFEVHIETFYPLQISLTCGNDIIFYGRFGLRKIKLPNEFVGRCYRHHRCWTNRWQGIRYRHRAKRYHPRLLDGNASTPKTEQRMTIIIIKLPVVCRAHLSHCAWFLLENPQSMHWPYIPGIYRGGGSVGLALVVCFVVLDATVTTFSFCIVWSSFCIVVVANSALIVGSIGQRGQRISSQHCQFDFKKCKKKLSREIFYLFSSSMQWLNRKTTARAMRF